MLVEDREDDVFLAERALAKVDVDISLRVVRNGDDAIAYLSGEGKFSDRQKFPLPRLILLDLKMPGRDGFDILHWIKQREDFKHIRVVVLTSSDQIRDVNRAYQLGANSFLVKPDELENFVVMTRLLNEYWFKLDVAFAVPQLGTLLPAGDPPE